ncbi:hypothetical protein CQY20_06485 [Mycolicibacterium agri]|uniref:Uncharacterized protein n=1 Tax=Mycolicibacterium agri TaxID=36811 RepID=A0A2A7NAT4_MYCAG|nr:hypothetical protein CQY20_06485 [Mycolicibacterium agri]
MTDWFDNIADLSPSAWTALAAWLALCITVAALIYAWRQFQHAKQENDDRSQPNVSMYMEPSASDWHLIELVVKNFGQTPAYGIKLEFATPPTVARYEGADADNYVDIVPLQLPQEIPYLAPSQEWRTVWDSALDRKQLGEAIGSRFAGAVTFYDQPATAQKKGKRARKQFRTPAVLDWATLHPVERLELLTTHDLARQEKQKLELLRAVLAYYHYATTESRQEVLQAEINKMTAAANAQRDRYRSQFRIVHESAAPQHGAARQQVPAPPSAPREARLRQESPAAPVAVDELPQQQQRYDGPPQPYNEPPPQYDEEPPYDDDDAQYDEEPPYDDDDAQTRVINGRHRRIG